jgi:hypothetical protein
MRFVTSFMAVIMIGCSAQSVTTVPSYCYENSSYGKDEPESEYEYICHVPLEALVANPKPYDGYYVYSEGLLKFDNHGDYLYLSCASAQASRWRGHIGIRDQQYGPPESEPMEGYVYHVVGTFRYSDMAIRDARLHYMPPIDDSFSGCTFREGL